MIKKIALLLAASKASEHSKKELSVIERRRVKSECDDVDLIRSGKPPVTLFKSNNRWEEIIIGRNEIIFTALKNICSRDQVPARIAVVYGSAHMLFVEDYLLQNGYQPIIGSEGWLVVANLCPLTSVTGNNAPTFKKIYASADGLMRIYLIGSSTNDECSERDKWFVRSRIFGWEKSQNDRVMEILYTPDDIDYVEKNLLLSGFVLTSEAQFVRKNNKKRHCVCDDRSYIRGGSFDVAIENNF